jgi:uncharacterized delta-60 repeat protein
MTRSLWHIALATSVWVLLAGCGGGAKMGIDGTGNDGSIVSYGRLSSFGSIEINGVHYDTASATFLVDGAAATEADIGLGDIVFVEGRIEPGATRGVAQKVMSDRVLQGRVDTVDASGGLLLALGQTVLVDQETQFDVSIAGGLAGLQVGGAVSVSGFRDAQGAIVATRIARQTAGAVALKTTGAVTSIDTAARLLTINGLVVDYASAQLLPAGTTSPPALGVFIEVKLASQDGSGVFTATSVEVRRQRLQGGAGIRVHIEGYVTSAGAANSPAFEIDGLPVITTGSTTVAGTVSADKRVTARGSLDAGGAVVASSFDGANRAPVAADVAVSTLESTELTGMLPTATDADGDAITYGFYSPPQSGWVGVDENGSYRYTPFPDFSGSDSFVYRVFDDRGGISLHTVTVTVTPVDNDAPTVQGLSLAASMGEGLISIDTFGADGAYSSGLALQADDRILVTGLCDVCPLVKRFLADGTPDFTVNAGGPSANAYGIAVASDGKIVIAGSAAGSNWDFALTRLNADGTLDRRVSNALSPGPDEASELALLPDGRVLMRGYRYLLSGDDFVGTDFPLVRYNADGSMDTSFGGGDGIITPNGSVATLKGSFAALPDGRVLVAEPVSDSSPIALLRRYQTDGVTPDAGFGGGDGVVELAFNASVALQPDGRVALVGCNEGGELLLQRLNADGTPDAGFGGGDGIVTATIGARGDCRQRIVIQPDGKLLVAISSYFPASGPASVLVRFHGDGSLDTGFGGGDGIVRLSTDVPLIAVQSNGSIVVAAPGGLVDWPSVWPHMYIMRLHSDGAQDLDFGTRRPLYEGQPFSRTIPVGTFLDPEGDALTVAATLADGSPLPLWLHFDTATLTFSGTPPAGAPDLYIKVTATDPGGRSVSDRFGLRVLAPP